jgi:hypothetical protein
MWNKARNRWYALSLILGGSDETTKVINVAMQAGFSSTDAMRTYFLRWGDKMVEAYGKLPYRMLNSKAYIKYMELTD